MPIFTKLFSPCRAKLAPPPLPPEQPEKPQMPLRIIHAGGTVESYYMALPAARIMEKYPRLVLARPEVFNRPWESIVLPNEILPVGEKFYLVPRGTIRKLQRRSRRRPAPRLPIPEEADGGGESNPSSIAGSWRKRVQFIDTWQPSLVAINESSSST